MDKIAWKGGAMLSPVPAVMVSCGTMDAPNILTIAWTGILATNPPKTYISVRPGRFSYPLIKESGEFVINLTTEQLVRAADYCGVRSGRDEDKFKAMGLTAVSSAVVKAPTIAESPISVECRVKQVIPLGSHDMFIAEVVNVSVDEQYIDPESGKFDLQRAKLIAYSHGEYYKLGEAIGHFGWSVRKKAAKK